MTDLFEARVSLTREDLPKRVHVEHDETTLTLIFRSYNALYAFGNEMAALLEDADRWFAKYPDAPKELEDLDGITG